MELSTAISLIDHPLVRVNSPQRWADLGCGRGLFTRALSELLTAGSEITAVDVDRSSLAAVHTAAACKLKTVVADFEKDALPFADLDGILMANAIHFVKNKQDLIRRLSDGLTPAGRFLIVEYDTSSPNGWVPFPLEFAQLAAVFTDEGFPEARLINRVPSAFGRSMIYGAIFSRESIFK